MAREKSAERPKKQTEADRAVHEAAVAATLEEVDYEYEPTMSDGDMFGDAPAKKAENFWPSFNRLMSLLKPEWVGMTWVTLLVVVSVALVVIAPRILGQATDVIFSGAVGTIDQKGQLIPGTGIDFVELGRLLMIVLAMYIAASLLQWWQGYILNALVMRVVYGLRGDIENKLNRLPLRYFD